MNRAMRRLMEQSQRRTARQQRRQEARIQRGIEAPTPEHIAAREAAKKQQELRKSIQEAATRQRTTRTARRERQVQEVKSRTRDKMMQRIERTRRINNPDREARRAEWHQLTDNEKKMLGEMYETTWERWDSRNEMEPVSGADLDEFIANF